MKKYLNSVMALHNVNEHWENGPNRAVIAASPSFVITPPEDPSTAVKFETTGVVREGNPIVFMVTSLEYVGDEPTELYE